MERIKQISAQVAEHIAGLFEVRELPTVEEGEARLQHSSNCLDPFQLKLITYKEVLPGGAWVPNIAFSRTLLVCDGCDANVQVRREDE